MTSVDSELRAQVDILQVKMTELQPLTLFIKMINQLSLKEEHRLDLAHLCQHTDFRQMIAKDFCTRTEHDSIIQRLYPLDPMRKQLQAVQDQVDALIAKTSQQVQGLTNEFKAIEYRIGTNEERALEDKSEFNRRVRATEQSMSD